MSSRPAVLTGTEFVVTADRRSAELAAALERRGARVSHAPALSIVPHVDDEALATTTAALLEDGPDVTVVTTGIGFRGWIEAADAVGRADDLLEVLRRSRIVARGPKARGAIQAAGLQADWVAESETSAEIRDLLLAEGVAGSHVAVQHHGAGADGVDEALAAAGARVTSLVVYRWGPSPAPDAVAASTRRTAAREVDGVLFTSAPGAAAWLQAAREQGVLAEVVAACSHDVVAAAVGPVTAGPLQDAGVEPLVPDRGRLGSLVRAVVTHFSDAGAIDTVAGRLVMRRGAAVLEGRALPLSANGLAVLRLLARRPGEVVSRSEVLTALAGASQDPHTAEVAVARLREACETPDLVQTVVKRGYRLSVGTAGA